MNFNRENIFGKYLRSDLIEEEIKYLGDRHVRELTFFSKRENNGNPRAI
jgi:hypothetical protein